MGKDLNRAHLDHELVYTCVTWDSRECARPFVKVLYFNSHLACCLPFSANVPFGCRLHVGEWKQHHQCHHPCCFIDEDIAYDNDKTRNLYRHTNCADIWCNIAGWSCHFQFDLSVMHFLSFPSSFSFWKCQNYFKDGWNIFDCVTVLGSITDILVTELGVSKKHGDRRQKCKYVNVIYYQWLRGH